jgi:hypothetical protein
VRPVALVLALAGTAVALTACGDTVIDHKKAEKTLKERIDTMLGTSVTVSCPSGVKAKAGGTVTCDVTGAPDGSKAQVVLEEQDAKGNVTFKLPLDTKSLAATLASKGGQDVKCPVLVSQKTGLNFTCTLKDNAGTSHNVAVTQGANGHVDYKLTT